MLPRNRKYPEHYQYNRGDRAPAEFRLGKSSFRSLNWPHFSRQTTQRHILADSAAEIISRRAIRTSFASLLPSATIQSIECSGCSPASRCNRGGKSGSLEINQTAQTLASVDITIMSNLKLRTLLANPVVIFSIIHIGSHITNFRQFVNAISKNFSKRTLAYSAFLPELHENSSHNADFQRSNKTLDNCIV